MCKSLVERPEESIFDTEMGGIQKMKNLVMLILLTALGCGGNDNAVGPQSDMDNLARLRREMEMQRAPAPIDKDGIPEKSDQTSDENVADAFNKEWSRLEGIYDSEYERLGGKKKEKTTSDVKSSELASDSEWERLATILVRDVKPGMSAERVRSLMGPPHEVNEHDVAGKHIVIWTWKKGDDPENSFIHLDVTAGSVQAGGSLGYDIRKGFKTKLPSYNVGGPEERAKLKQTLENLGVEVEE